MTTQPTWVPRDTFGARLALLRRELKLSTEEIADRCGLNRATWQTWEHGSSPRKMDSVVTRIALATGVSREWLMWGGPLGGLDSPSGGPSVSPIQPSISDNDTELMQYRSSLTRASKITRGPVKVAA